MLSAERIQRDLDRPVARAIRRAVGRMRTAAVNAFVRRGLGRAIFGKKKTGARKIIRDSKVRKVGERWTTEVRAGGIAGLQESGGRTKAWAHPVKVIKGRGAPFTRQGRHPGMAVPRHPFLRAAVTQGQPYLYDEVRKAAEQGRNAAVTSIAKDMARSIPGAKLVL